MAVLKRSLRRKNATGNYDTIRLESDSSIVYRPSGRTVEQDLAAYLPSTQSSDVVPKTLVFGKLLSATNKFWVGNSNNAPIELITTLNVGDYAGGSSGAPEVTVPEYPGTIPALGKTFSFVGYTWLVAHKENGVAYCVTNDIVKNIKLGYYTDSDFDNYNDYVSDYIGSTRQIECQKMAISTGIQYADYVLNMGAGKVFIPSYSQMLGESGGFSWFNSNSRRIAYLSGYTSGYWTSTTIRSAEVVYINYDGEFIANTYGTRYTSGFRPCICIQY